MADYDKLNFDPPAPVAYVTIRNVQSGIEINDLPMLIDTGADVTLLPIWATKQISLHEDESKSFATIGFDGTIGQSIAVTAEMTLLKKKFRGKFLVIENEIGIIGRNILNSLTLVLDGKHLAWNEKQTPG